MGRQDKAAPGAEHIVGLWVVRTDLGVWIFDWLDHLSAVLATEFHGAILPPADQGVSHSDIRAPLDLIL